MANNALAREAPKLSSDHFPGFFAPHDHHPKRVRLEPRFGAKAIDELRRRGHEVELAPDWTEGSSPPRRSTPKAAWRRAASRNFGQG